MDENGREVAPQPPPTAKPKGKPRGRPFQPGNTIGRLGGNPHAKQTHDFRALIYSEIRPKDLKEVLAKLVTLAKAGEEWAVRELLNRTMGKPQDRVEMTGQDGAPLFLSDVQRAILLEATREEAAPGTDAH